MSHPTPATLPSPPAPFANGRKTERKTGLNTLPESMYALQTEYFASKTDDPLTGAFSRKSAVHAGMNGERVADADIADTLRRLRAMPRTGPAAAYVHLPYCESKCLYCGFFGGTYTEKAGAAYVNALIRELEMEKGVTGVTSSPVNALYLGGGTPTALQPQELTRLLLALRACLPLANDCEITVEGRIHNFDKALIEACLEGGANRFSIGVQSFDTDIRRRLGRFSDKEEVCRRLRTLASYNQAAVIIDLIYGLPGQTLEHWKRDIATFLELPLDGVDLYQLNIFPGSALARGIEVGTLPAAATLAEQGRFFEQGVSLMQSARCRRLSMSHWGRTARERNLYNPMAKGRADCLHYGAGAGGSLHGWFMFNEANAERYIRSCTDGEKPVAMVAAPPEDLAVMRVILGQMEQCRLNLNDVSAALARTRTKEHANAQSLYAPLLENWEKAGLVTRDEPWMELTLAGQFWQVNLAQALIGWQHRMNKE